MPIVGKNRKLDLNNFLLSFHLLLSVPFHLYPSLYIHSFFLAPLWSSLYFVHFTFLSRLSAKSTLWFSCLPTLASFLCIIKTSLGRTNILALPDYFLERHSPLSAEGFLPFLHSTLPLQRWAGQQTQGRFSGSSEVQWLLVSSIALCLSFQTKSSVRFISFDLLSPVQRLTLSLLCVFSCRQVWIYCTPSSDGRSSFTRVPQVDSRWKDISWTSTGVGPGFLDPTWLCWHSQ